MQQYYFWKIIKYNVITSRKPVRCIENELKLNLKIIGLTMIFIIFYILSKYENW